ncbi:MAG: DUF1249 domain-containing protein [Pseudomonadales bacterium]|nr:DUF1249 domain-containing protein [Pseudomonadales bacterium]MCP5213747.1 DUF1249 domain-containing protein [Pseudomonadales bacterium]
MKKLRYVPDLCELMAECEANYARLQKLMPTMEQATRRIFGVASKSDQPVQICLEVIEEFKYTATIRFTHQDKAGHWLRKPALLIRIYHDARMAEVVELENSQQLKGVYRYPNAKMYQPDEKMQRNLYLGEWLRQCLAQGYAVDKLDFARVF